VANRAHRVGVVITHLGTAAHSDGKQGVRFDGSSIVWRIAPERLVVVEG
jgi:hypothetical protein